MGDLGPYIQSHPRSFSFPHFCRSFINTYYYSFYFPGDLLGRRTYFHTRTNHGYAFDKIEGNIRASIENKSE